MLPSPRKIKNVHNVILSYCPRRHLMDQQPQLYSLAHLQFYKKINRMTQKMYNLCLETGVTRKVSGWYIYFASIRCTSVAYQQIWIWTSHDSCLLMVKANEPRMPSKRREIMGQISPGLNANEIQIPYDRHYKVSSLLKSHRNTQNSVRYEVIWKCQISCQISILDISFLFPGHQ